MRRLYSTFAQGWPGAGLLFLRLVIGIALIVDGLIKLGTQPSVEMAAVNVLGIVLGFFVAAGLWMPISGSLTAVLGFWRAVSQAADPLSNVFLGAIGVALALLGPGAYSIDARLFGWKRINFGGEKRHEK